MESPFVSQVVYDIETNGTFGIQKVSVSFRQTNLTVRPGASMQQGFIVRFRVGSLLSDRVQRLSPRKSTLQSQYLYCVCLSVFLSTSLSPTELSLTKSPTQLHRKEVIICFRNACEPESEY